MVIGSELIFNGRNPSTKFQYFWVSGDRVLGEVPIFKLWSKNKGIENLYGVIKQRS
jgi:hypothetical protein